VVYPGLHFVAPQLQGTHQPPYVGAGCALSVLGVVSVQRAGAPPKKTVNKLADTRNILALKAIGFYLQIIFSRVVESSAVGVKKNKINK